MRYDDASQAAADHNAPVARPDVDVLPSGSYGPATGNALTGQGTTTGASGADSTAGPATIVAVQGAGGPGVMGNGAYQVSGQYGALSIDTHGNFNYVRNPGTPDGVRDVFQYTLADASGTNASTTLTIDIAQVAAAAAGQTMVALPAGVELSDIHVNGRDLVINMPDGTQMVIPNGAVFVPQLTIGDVQVPASNVAALLIDSEPQPAAGPPQSSGGNFATDVPPLDPGVPLGDLIPPTEFGFTPPQFEELAQAVDRKPTVIIETPDNPAGAIDASESVNEKGLPARNGNEPAGSGEIADGNGTNDSDSTETNTGTIVFTAQDGLDSLAINGTAVTAVGQHIAGQFGTITITGINLANGQITYSYTLGDNTSGDATQDVFTVAVTDDDGDVANASLTVHIVDDVPTARNDTDATDKTSHVATGNVMSGADTTSGTSGADTVGADNAAVTAVSGVGGSDNAFDANGNLEVQGQFGTLTIKADGSYTYHGGAGAVGGSVDTFTYTLTDGDGDTSQATLIITNPDQTPTIVIQTPDNPAGAVNATESVFEKGLPARNGGEPAGSGEIADGNGTNNSDASETNTGTIVLSSPDGVGSVTINGTAVTGVGQHIAGASGTLTITSYNLATGQIGYSYTLADNTSGDSTHDDFTVVVTDTDGDAATGTLRVNIVDDAPTARNDSDSIDVVTHLATGNVITGADTTAPATGADTVGADNATVSAVQGAGGSDSSFDASGNLEVHGQFGTLTIKADGSYVYTLNAGAPGGSTDTFTYTLKDGDGDTSQATLTISNPDHTPTIVIQTPDQPAGAANATEFVFEKGLPARNGGEPAGSGEIADGNGTNNSDSSETNTGTIVLSSQDGISSVTINNTAVTGVNQHITGASGTITITSIDLATGQIGYSYTLTDNTSGDATHDDFSVVVTDNDGDTATATLRVNIVDDVPTAHDDTDAVTEDTSSVATGNVITGVGSDGNAAGGDVVGADNAVVTLVDGLNPGIGQATATAVGVSIIGQYGTLLIHSDGSYTYTLDNANGAVQALGAGEHLTESFQYTLHDGDGDDSAAVLTITINGTNDAPVAVADTNWTAEGSAAINGNVLASITHPGAPSGTFADAADSDVDGDVLTVTQVNGGPIANPITGAHGTLTINANGTYSYQVNNADPAVSGLGVGQTVTDTFTYAVSDGNGGTASASLTITIFGTNDAPTAVADTNWTVEGSATAATGNMLANLNHPGAPSGSFADHADTDPDAGDTLSVTQINGGSIANPITGAHGTLTVTANGAYSYQVNNADPAVSALGAGQTITDTFTYAVSDGHGGTASATLTITIFGTNDAPTAVADTNWTVEDSATAATGNVLANLTHAGAPSGSFADHADTDPDSGDTLSVTQVNGGSIANPIAGAHGTLTINANGTYSYQVNNADPVVQALGVGATTTDTFTYAVSDGHGGTASATLTITIFGTNDAPSAVADTNWTVEDGVSINGNVLADLSHPGAPSGSFADHADTDPDSGDTLSVTQVNGGSIVNPITGAHGTLTINANGTYSYQVNNADPAVQALGVGATTTDTFTYAVSDGHGGTASATLTITIFGSNDAPTAVADTNWTVEGGGSISGDVLANLSHPGAPAGSFADHADTDPDAGDTLSVTQVNGGSIANPITGAHGTLTINANGTYSYQVNNADPAVVGLGLNQTITDTFTYAVSDGHGGTASATLTITIFGTNDGPTAVPDTNWTVEDGASINGNVLASISHPGAPSGTFADVADSDPNSDPLTVTDVNGNAANVGVDLTGQHGTVHLNANGTYTYQVNNADPAVQALSVGQTITDTFTYAISDGHGGTASASLTITIFGANDAPTAVADTNWTVEDSATAATGNVLQNLNHAGAPSGSFADHADSDPDAGDTLSVSAVNGNAANVGNDLTGAHGTLHLNSNGTYSYQVNNADPAVQALGAGATTTDTFNYTVSDGHGGTASASLTITIFGVNDAPRAVADTNWTIEDSATAATGNVLQNVAHPGDPSAILTFADVADTDPDAGDTLTVSAVNGSAANVGNDLGGAHGTLHLNSNGSYTYQVNNADGAVQALGVGDTLTDSFTYTVSDGHGGTSSTTLTITIFGANDGPSIASSTAHVSEEGLANANVDSTGYPDNSADTTNSAQVLNGHVNVSDPDNDPLTVTLSNPPAGITVQGQPVTWTPSNGGHTLTATVVLNAVVTPVMTITIDDSGNYTVNLQHAIDHPYQGVTGVGAGGEDAIHFDVQLNVSDGISTSTSSLTIYIEDDSPNASTNGSGVGSVTLDESPSGTDTSGGSNPTGLSSATINLAAGFVTGASVVYGADGAATSGAVTYALHLSGSNVASGLYALEPSDTQGIGGDGDGIGQGAQIVLNQSGNVITGTVGATPYFTITIDPNTGIATFHQLLNIWHPTAGSTAAALDDTATLTTTLASDIFVTQTVKDADGDTANATISLGSGVFKIQDDGPTLGTVQSQQTDNSAADNDPVLKDATGTLHFSPGTDGAGLGMTITANMAGITSGGHAIVTHQVGNVLTAYQDFGPAGYDAGDTTVVFTLTVNPTAGTSGQYVFDLVTPIDATVVDTPVGGSTSFGAGPQPYQVVSATNVSTDPLAILTGWHTNGSFDVTNWYNGTNQLPAGVTIANINGSTAGWGVDSNNFTAGQFIRWDFGEPPDDFDGPGGYNPPNPAVDLPKISTATFELLKYSSSDHFQWVVHFTDGTTASFSNDGSAGQFTYSAPAGKFIDWVDTYTPDAGAGKIDIVSVGVSSSSTDKTIPFTLQLSDVDGDTTSTANFSIHIKDGLTPFAPAAPVVLDLNGDGVHFVGTSAGVTYDYGHGAVATAWASPQDGILVHDANHNGNVDSASEFVFAGVGQTDLQGLAVYDTNHDGQLTAADADFSSFAVWQDANSNGKVDAGELSSLTARGIVSVSLSSDGIAYTSAGGDVEVAGTGSFTWSNGVKGTLADAAFVTTARSFGDETRSPSASASNLTLIAALAAAGLSSASASYAESHASFQGDALPLAGSFGHEAFTTTVAATGSSYHGFDASSMLGTWLPHDVARGEVSMPTAHNEIVSRQALTTNDVKGPAFAELLQGSHGASHADAHAGTPVTAMAVAMPSAAQLVAAGSAATTGHGQTVAGPNALQHNEVVSKVLADSLNGGEGHGPNVEALVNQLGGHGSGHSALEALASQAGGAGSFGHMGLAIAFGGMHGMGMEMMHQDAAPAHG